MEIVKKSTKISLALMPAISLALLGVLWLSTIKPWVLKTVQAQIPKVNQMQDWVQIDVKSIDFSLIKLQVYASDVSVTLNKDASNTVTVPRIRMQIDPFNLLIGQLNVSYLRLDDAKINLNETILNLTPKSDNKEIDLQPLFKLLPKIPVDKIVINDTELNFDIQSVSAKLRSNIDLLTVANQKKALLISLSDSEHELITKNISKITGASVRLSAQAELTENKLELIKLTSKVENSFLSANGTLKNFKMAMIKPEFNVKTNGTLIFENLKPFYYFFDASNKRLPQILGQLKFSGQLQGEGFTKNSGNFALQTENLKFDFIKLGNADIKMDFKDNNIRFDEIHLDHPAGEASLTSVEFTQEKPFKFKSQVKVSKFNLQKLFNSLELKNIPADFSATVTGDCAGQLMPFQADCDTKINAENIWVKSSLKNDKYIVQIKKTLAVNGKVNLNLKGASFDAQAKLNTSEFTTTGKVDFNEGFDMKFKANNFELADIDNLAHLNLKGLLSGELTTSGNTDRGIIDAKINAKNFEIDKFHLGNLTGDLSYKAARLGLHNLVGDMEQSQYNGDLDINFKNSTIKGQVNLPKLYGKSIISILKDRFYLPFTLTGQGQGSMTFSGPLDFWKMQYTLQAELNRGAVAEESFNQLTAHLTATGEKVNFDRMVLTKPSGQINVGGYINTQQAEPHFNLEIGSQNLRAEEVDHFVKLLPKSTGLITLTGKVTETIEKIQISGQTSLRDFTIEGQSLLSSQGDLIINRNFLSFNGQVFGRQAQAAIQIPFSEQHDFIIKAQLRDLNPLTFLPLIKIPPPAVDTNALLTAEVDLHSRKIDFSTLKGFIKLNNFLLQRSNQTLKLQKPSEITFASGLKSLTPISLRGSDQTVDITQHNSIINFNGKILLRPLQFLVPALENLNGLLEFDFGLNLNSQKLSLAGDGSLKNGLVQLKGFPYPIKEINASLDFSQSKLIISSVQAQLNQSPITGFGFVNFLGSQNIDVNIQAESSRVDLEFPPQIQTSGLVKVKISGNWLPYTLKIDYNIDQGLVTKEFTGGEDDMKLTLAPSRYLPPQQLNQQSPTLLLDINPKFPKGIIVKNSILEGTAIGELRITGSPEIPIITGRIDLTQGSKLIFKDKPFDILTGFVIFNPGEQKSADINPEIFLNASSRVSDYDINLLISGQAKTLAIKPTSQPPLSENDIFSLLALGFTSAKQDQNLTSDTQQKQTGLEVIAALSNQSKFNKQIQEKLGLNVQIAPSVDSTKNIAVPKVVVSRKLTKKINASYSRPLTGSQQSNEVKLQWLFHPDYSLNLNYQNQTDTNETSIIQNNENDKGNYGVDLEYKKEFK
ncbi:hypothetical protein CIK05_06315 [Bdellovibrio sp. qaytius]|nr:hypothetical protein CIK05_06315 [Bdellovibrio sp. qaytius]